MNEQVINMTKKIGCLIVHGFGGSLEEISPLSNYLTSKGFYVVCPKLKGHTGKRRDLRGVSYEDWIESAEEGLKKLEAYCDSIVLIGFSMGGLISVNLSLKYKVHGIVTLNCPIYYWDFKKIFLNILQDIYNKKPSHISRYIKSSLDKPLSSLINFKVLLQKTKPLFKEVRCPIFIAQALGDEIVQVRSAEYIYKNISSHIKQIKYYKDSNHLICLSSISQLVLNDILEFISNIV